MSTFELPQNKQKILEIEDRMSAPDFWSDPARAKIVAQELDRVKTEVSGWEKFEQDLAELAGMAEMALKEQDKALEADLMAKFGDLRGLFEHLRLSTFLSQKYDKNNAFLSIHAGAGGGDAQDWAEMLLRMYLRFAEKEKFKALVVDESKINTTLFCPSTPAMGEWTPRTGPRCCCACICGSRKKKNSRHWWLTKERC